MKKQVNIRANDKTVSQIRELADMFNMTQAEVVAYAVDMYHRHQTSQTHYQIFKRHSGEMADVIDEAAFQRELSKGRKNAPPHVARADFIVWSGPFSDIPQEYLLRNTVVYGT